MARLSAVPNVPAAIEAVSLLVLSAYITAALLLAALWTHCFRRGPLEYLLNVTTRMAHHVR